MAPSVVKTARLRERRRKNGYKETTIWLTQEADAVISKIVESKGLKNRSEAVQYALSLVSQQEPQMRT